MISRLETKCWIRIQEERTKESIEILKICGKVHTSSIQQEVTMHSFYKKWMEQSYLEVLSMEGCSSTIFVEVLSLKLYSLYITMFEWKIGKMKHKNKEKNKRGQDERKGKAPYQKRICLKVCKSKCH